MALGVCGLLRPTTSYADQPLRPRPTYHAVRRSSPIVIDGRVDEAAWQQAEVASEFIERNPRPGAVPPVRTDFRVSYDENDLYFSFVCFMPPGERPVARDRRRDPDSPDDRVFVRLDVRLDRRSALSFVVSAAGAQRDVFTAENGQTVRVDWDGIWDSAVTHAVDRWSVEMRIPASTLGLPHVSGEHVVGMTALRNDTARGAVYEWAQIPIEFGEYSALHFGSLRGLERVGSGTPLTLIPYLAGGHSSSDIYPVVARAGGELRARLGGDIWMEATALPDFAQVDLDDPRIVTDRFPLFFPERRPFFLSGIDLFTFGHAEQLQVFFTRRVGLDGRARPILSYGGAKVYGRAGAFSFGVLDVVTDSTPTRPVTNAAVGRFRLSLDGRAGYIGAIVVSRQDFEPADPNVRRLDPHISGGADMLLRLLDERLELRGFGALTTTQTGGTIGGAGEFVLRYLSTASTPQLTIQHIDPNFVPELGFVRRRAMNLADLTVPYFIRGGSGEVALITFQGNAHVETSHDLEQLLIASAELRLSVEGRSKWLLAGAVRGVEDRVTAPFTLYGGLSVPVGTYRRFTASVTAQTATTADAYVALDYTFSVNYFGGLLNDIALTFRAFAGDAMRILATPNVSLLLDPTGRLWTGFAGSLTATFTPSTAVQFDLIAQAASDTSSFTGLARLRWRYAPGSDLYLVYRETVGALDQAELTFDRSIMLKVMVRMDTLL